MKRLFTVMGICLSMPLFAQHIPGDTTTTEEEKEKEVLLYAPNAFTPDGDAFNETWRVYAEGIDLYDFHLIVFNRSGEIVWESFNVIGEWDGTYGGQYPAKDGIYAWVIEAKDAETDERYQYTGTVALFR